MEIKQQIEKCKARIGDIKKELAELGDMQPGTLLQRYNVCGCPSCRCKDPKNPKKHGPYYQLGYSHKGRNTTEFVKKGTLAQVKLQIENFKRFKELTEEWIDLAVTIAKLTKKLDVK